MAELEQRGLIYKIKGKGTFARPRDQARERSVAFLLREPWKVSHFYNAELLRGMQQAVAAQGVNLVIVSTTPGEWTPAFMDSLVGVAVLPRLLIDSDLNPLRKRLIPYCIAMESDLSGPSIEDNVEQAAYELTAGLIARGHRCVALVSGHFEHADRRKKRGMQRAAEEANIDFRTWPDYCTNYDPALAYEICHDVFAAPAPPSAVIGFDNMLAVQAIRAARDLGLSVPGDLSVAGFGGRDLSDLISPPLTTVNLRGEEAGRRAVESLFRAGHVADAPLEVGYDIVWRASVAPA